MKVKTPLAAALLILAVCCAAGPARAALIDNGGGLIYDPGQNITWYDASNNVYGWDNAAAAAGVLNAGGVTGWQLPTMAQMSYLYYTDLGSVLGGPLQPGPFKNLLAVTYWSSEEYGIGTPPPSAWSYDFSKGTSTYGSKYAWGYAIAVHPGDITTTAPLPAALFLLGPGLLGLAAIRRRLGK